MAREQLSATENWIKDNHVTFDRTIVHIIISRQNTRIADYSLRTFYPEPKAQTKKLVDPIKNCKFTITATAIRMCVEWNDEFKHREGYQL